MGTCHLQLFHCPITQSVNVFNKLNEYQNIRHFLITHANEQRYKWHERSFTTFYKNFT